MLIQQRCLFRTVAFKALQLRIQPLLNGILHLLLLAAVLQLYKKQLMGMLSTGAYNTAPS